MYTVHEVAFSRDGRALVSGAMGEGGVRIWDPKTGEEQRVLDHDAGPRVVLGPPDSHLLITVSDVAVAVHDLDEGTSRRLDGHTDAIFGLDVSPDGALVVSSSRDTTARLWDLARGQTLHTLRAHTDVVYDAVFSPDGKQVLTVSKDGTARLWDARTGEAQDVLEGSFDAIRSAAFHPAGGVIAIVSVDGGVRLWTPGSDEVKLVGRHRGRAYGVAFHPSGDRLASAGADGTARIWKLDGGGEIVLRGHKDEVNRAVFSPDGAWLATCSDDATVRLWHADSGRPYWRAPVLLSSPPRLLSHRGWQALAGNDAPPPDSKWRTAIGRDALFVTRTADVSCMQTYDDHVELWNGEERLARKKFSDVQQVLAIESGCIARTEEEAGLLTRAGQWRRLNAAKPSAVGPAPGGFAIAAEGRVTTYSSDAQTGSSCPAGERVTALAHSHGAMVVGYADGDLALCGSDEASPSFADVPASAPVSILEGPNETIIVGYASGVVGIWNQRDGTRLAHARMHGSVIHLLLEAHKLYAASDLGAHLVWDLSAFYRDYCELLREVWSRVPVVWQNGRAELEPPPGAHRCSH